MILHEQEFDKSVGRAAVAKHLQKIRKDYNARRKTLDFDELLTRLPDAERRAIQQMKARIAELGGRLNPPYTTVNRLTKAISSPLRLCL